MEMSVYDQCIQALDNVTGAFAQGRKGLNAPTCYEADFAACKLMQQVYLHVNAISHIAAIRYTGSHLTAAWPLLRTAFETALRTLWLVQDDDWKERESRWLGWVTEEERYLKRLAKEFDAINVEYAQRLRAQRSELERRRKAIDKLLPKDSRMRNPSVPELISEVGLEAKYYIWYRIASHFSHGGPSSSQCAVKRTEEGIAFVGVVQPRDWKGVFRSASWSITAPGLYVLLRSGADQAVIETLNSQHDRLIEVTEQLDEDEEGS